MILRYLYMNMIYEIIIDEEKLQVCDATIPTLLTHSSLKPYFQKDSLEK
jgi:hypothetical protein